MTRFLLSRLFQSFVTVLALSFLVFAIGRTTGNPADTLLSLDATAAEREAFIKREGLDQPLAYQFWVYVSNAAQGDFGVSLRTRRPVVELVGDRLVSSLTLVSVAFIFALVISVPLGVLAAVHRHRFWDRAALVISLLGQSLPSFLIGLLWIVLFAVTLQWLPTSGTGTWQHYILPSLTIGWFIAASIVRLLRSSMLEVLNDDYIRTARAKGLAERTIVWKHAVRNALMPVVTYLGLMYGITIASAITTEVVFNWPGLGRLAYEAVLYRDFPLLQFTVLVWAVVIMAINLVVDLAYLTLDPRVSIG